MMTPADQRPATERQLEIHAFMVAFHEEHGVWPSVREIADHFGFVSTNGVHQQLVALKLKGLARQRPRCARGWIAVERNEDATR